MVKGALWAYQKCDYAIDYVLRHLGCLESAVDTSATKYALLATLWATRETFAQLSAQTAVRPPTQVRV